MDTSRITKTYVARFYIDMNLNRYFMPDVIELMAKWVYTHHNDFLEEYYDMFDEDGEWLGHITRDQIKAMNAKQAKLAKEFKKVFPDVKQQNVMYENIMKILKEIILDENA